MDTKRFADDIRFARGHVADSLGDDVEHGDAATGGRNVIWDALGKPSSWRGVSYARKAAAPLLHSVNNKLAGNTTGNIWQQHGRATYFIGTGKTYYDDFATPVGVSSSLLQVHVGGQSFQAGLPAPPSPLLSLGLDSAGQVQTGQVTGSRTTQLTRVRSVTGAESPASDPSNLVIYQNGKARVEFPAAVAAAGQDQWGVYFTEQGRGDIGPAKLLKYLAEADLIPAITASISDAPGNGATATFGGTSAAATVARISALSLAPSGGSAPVRTGVSQSRTAGAESIIRVPRPQGAQVGDLIVVGMMVKAVHNVTPGANNRGSVIISQVTGGWYPLQTDKIEIEQISTTQFRWRLLGAVGWQPTLALTTTPVLLPGTGLRVGWSAATSGLDEVGNMWVITPYTIASAPGWNVGNVQGDTDDTVTLYQYWHFVEANEPAFDDWNGSQPANMFAVAGSYSGVHATVPFADTQQTGTLSGTTHQLTFGAAPGATNRVVFFYAGVGAFAFTSSAPLVVGVDTSTVARVLDFDFTDSDLSDILAPRNVSPPPAGTHGFPLGAHTVIAGTEDGTGLNISMPGQPELYDLTLTTYLNPAEPVLRVDHRPSDGSVYIYTKNSVQTPILTGNQDIPLYCRALWPNTGAANPGAATLTDRGMYLYSAREGPCRSSGYEGPDTAFAKPVARYMRDNWNSDEVRVGHSQNLDAVAFCHRREMLLFFEKTGLWSLPLDLTDFIYVPGVAVADCLILSCVTLNGEMYLSVGHPLKGMAMHQAHVGPGSQWTLRSVPRTGGMRGYDKTVRAVRLTANLDVNMPLTYTKLTNIQQENGKLVANSLNAGGYCVAEPMLPQAIESQTTWYFEFEITGPMARERQFIVTDADELTDANIGALVWNSAPVQIGARITTGNVLEAFSGAMLTYGAVLAGDLVRIGRVGALGTYGVQVIRGGASLGVVVVTPLTLTQPIGIKVTLAADSTLGPGRFAQQQSLTGAQVRLYRNRGAENGQAANKSRTVFAAGNATYDWGKVNLPEAETYSVELIGIGPDQDIHNVLVEGFSTMRKRGRRGGLKMNNP